MSLFCLGQLELIQREIGTPEADLSLTEARGTVALARGEHREASGYFASAASQWRTLKRPYEIGQTLNKLGHVYAGAGKWTAAQRAFQQAMDIFEHLVAQLGDPDLVESFYNPGLVRDTRRSLEITKND
ncbi:MAG: hypothetical protein A2W36_03945 [Chloroflexi bacterium RBG_16_58_14]|nr:MAG: hypothetical protein A2W36_03945 [Chloroflexi bacterium RBG_16_58_14]